LIYSKKSELTVDLDLKSLALFVRVTELGAIGKAGLDFDLSSTNASQRILALEAELGVKLFHRSTRVVTPTYEGLLFLEHAKRILDDVEETRNVFRGEGSDIQGRIRLTVSASYARVYIVPFIPELLRLHPKLEIEIDFTDKNVDIVEQGYDIAFRMGELQSSSLLAKRIADNPMILVASPEYLTRAGEPQTPADLASHNCIPFAKLNNWQFKDNDGAIHNVTVNGPIKVNSGDAIDDLVQAGVGIGLGSLWHVGPALRAGRVRRVLPGYKVWPQTRIWAVRPSGRLTPERIKVFLDYIEKVIHTTNEQRYGDLLITL
jgi:DNA-binding transcriptional LysR family regulator